MWNASQEQLAKLQYITDELKVSYKQFETYEHVDKLSVLHMIMCIHQCLEVGAEIVKPE